MSHQHKSRQQHITDALRAMGILACHSAADYIDELARSLSEANSRAERAEAEAQRTNNEVRADYDKTVAAAWRAELDKAIQERDQAIEERDSLKHDVERLMAAWQRGYDRGQRDARKCDSGSTAK